MKRLLLVLWSALLAAGLTPGLARPTALRVASSAVLVAVAWGCRAPGRGGLWVAAGMTLGCLGDALALPPQSALPAPRLLLAMGLFGLGHVAYLTAFVGALRDRRDLAGPAAGWAAAAAVVWQATANGVTPPSPLRWPALGYGLLLGATAAAATALARRDPRYRRVALGAALFFVSDSVLGWEAFRGGFPFDTELCWLTYGPGQMLIVTGWPAADGTSPGA